MKGLSFTADENHIGNHFEEQCGEVDSVNLLKGDRGSKGIAFVRFVSSTSIPKAIALSGSQHMGREIFVEKTQPREQRPAGGAGAFGAAPARAPVPITDDSTTVFVGNLSFGTTDDTLRSHFEGCGTVVSVRIAKDRETQQSRGFGHVEFTNKQGVEKALTKAGSNVDGRPI